MKNRNELDDALNHALDFISRVEHGDNCFVSRQYAGDPGDRCNCGKDSVMLAIENALESRATTAPSDAIAPTEGARTHTTQAGESVMGIAMRQCGNEAEWRHILACNPKFADMLPHEYFPVGTVLTMPAPSPKPAVDALTTGAVSAPPLGENKVAYLPKDIQDWGRFRTVATPYFCRPVSLVENWPVPLSMDQGHVLDHSVELRFEDEEDADLFFSMYSDAMGSAAAHPASEPKALTDAVAKYDALIGSLQGCTDGGCVISPPKGMHTNGGCRCVRDSMKMQRVTYAATELRKAIGALLADRGSEQS